MRGPALISRADAGRVHTFSTIRQPGWHLVRATCVEVGCSKQADGWQCRVDERTHAGRLWAHYIRHVTARQGWTEITTDDGLTRFRFPPGTPCFQDARDRRAQQTLGLSAHTRQIRPALHVVSTGDAQRVAAELVRAQQQGRPPRLQDQRVHTSGAAWVEELAERWNADAAVANN